MFFFRAQQYKTENDELHEKNNKSELEINDLVQINQVNYSDSYLNLFYACSGTSR